MTDDVRAELQAMRELLDELLRGVRELKTTSASAVTVEDAAARLGCSRSRVFELLKSGRLYRAERCGRRVLVTSASIEAALAEPESAPVAATGRTRRRGAAALEEEARKLFR